MKKYHWVLFCIIVLILSSCSSLEKKFQAVPTALSKTNQIVIICEEEMWEGRIGDTIKYYFESAYPIMPVPETNFDVKHFTAHDLLVEPIRKALRTYIILADLSEENATTTQMLLDHLGDEVLRRTKEAPEENTKIGHNKWARGQILFYVYGNNEKELAENIVAKHPAIAQRIREFDKPQINASAYIPGFNNTAQTELFDQMGIEMKIPSDFKIATSKKSVFWFRKDEAKISSHIVIHKLPYTDKNQFTKEGMKNIRDELMKGLVTSDNRSSVMVVNDKDLPLLLYNRDFGGHYTIEARGIWEMTNDFMAGPFFSYLIHNEEDNELIFADVFVHGPGQDKRNEMQELEHIVMETLKI